MISEPFGGLYFINQNTAEGNWVQIFGLEGRLVSSYEDYKQKVEELLQPIDYEPVYRILAEKRGEAIKFLEEALS